MPSTDLKSEFKADQKEFWEHRYQQNETHWNIGKEHPLLPKLVSVLERLTPALKGGTVLVPGAGHGHCAAFWANSGYPTTAADFAPSAIKEAKKLYGKAPNLRIQQQDIFQPQNQTYAIIYDRAMLCALPPQRRQDYCNAISSLIRSGGVFALISFLDIRREGGPPWQINVMELHRLLAPNFSLMYAEDITYEKKKDDQIIFGESLTLWLRQ